MEEYLQIDRNGALLYLDKLECIKHERLFCVMDSLCNGEITQ